MPVSKVIPGQLTVKYFNELKPMSTRWVAKYIYLGYRKELNPYCRTFILCDPLFDPYLHDTCLSLNTQHIRIKEQCTMCIFEFYNMFVSVLIQHSVLEYLLVSDKYVYNEIFPLFFMTFLPPQAYTQYIDDRLIVPILVFGRYGPCPPIMRGIGKVMPTFKQLLLPARLLLRYMGYKHKVRTLAPHFTVCSAVALSLLFSHLQKTFSRNFERNMHHF